MLFDPDYNLYILHSENSKADLLAQYEALCDKFLFWGNAKKPCGKISFIQTEYLLNFIEHIAKALQHQNAERAIQIISNKLMMINDTLKEDFFSTAKYVLEKFSNQFIEIPGFKNVWQTITSM